MRRANRLFLRRRKLSQTFRCAPTAELAEDELQKIVESVELSQYTSLVLSNFFGDKEIAFLAKMLHENEAITSLDLSRNFKLTSTAAETLGSVLKHSHVLQHLLLNDTSIDEDGATAIAKALILNTDLRTLRLQGTFLGKGGVAALSDALQATSVLSTLDLSRCEMGLAGAQKLATALESNNGLLSLVLDDNRLGNKAAVSFARALEVNKSLTALSLAENMIRDAGAKSLLGALEKNQSLFVLDLSDNSVDTAILEDIHWALGHIREKHKTTMLEALKSGEKAPWYRGKLMVIGEGRAGKTATVRSLLKKKFDANLESTIGVDTSETQAGGNESWRPLATQGFTQTFIKMIIANPQKVKALVSAQSTKKQENSSTESGSVNEAQEEKLEEESTHEAVVEGGVDTETQGKQRVQVAEFERLYEQETNKLVKGVTLRNAIKISIWDYGGQAVFQTLHHIFLTKYGLYLLVFSMEAFNGDPERSEDYIRFWLNSVKLHAPEAPVLIVGTFLDSVKQAEDVRSIHRSIHSIVNPAFPQVVLGNGAFLEIDNRRGIGIKRLREQIETITRDQEYIHFPVSIQWTKALDWMFARTKDSWLKYSEVLEAAQSMGIETEKEVKEMLFIFHELGVVFYFTGTETLSNLVTIRPQWLIDKIAMVIRDKQLHQHHGQAIQQANLVDEARKLFQEGLLSTDLARLLWDYDQETFLFDLMRQLLLISDWNFDGKGEYHLVPSMVTATPPAIELRGIKCKFTFEILPTGVYERLICVCVDYSSHQNVTREPEMYLNIGRVVLQPGNLVTLQKSQNEIVVDVEEPSQASNTLQILLLALKKLKNEVMGEGLVWTLTLEEVETAKFLTYADAKDAGAHPWFAPVAERPRATNSMDFTSFLETF